MGRMTKRLAVLLLLAVGCGVAADAWGQQSTPPQKEDAIDDVVVVTASRREEQLLNAPATMTVLTDEVIRNLPGQSITDLLRVIPGLNFVQTSARDVNVTTRAATGTLADSTLVLIDGRSFYQDFFGSVLWDFFPVDTSEVKQIEVIRGPASAVWGANAMTGVINIITKTPREMQGTNVAVRFGQFDRSAAAGPFQGGGLFSFSATHAHAPSDRFAYKLSAGVLAQEPLPRPVGTIPGTQTPYPGFLNSGTSQLKVDGRADYDLHDGKQKIIVAGGMSGTEGIIETGLGPLAAQPGSTFTYGRATYTRDKLRLQTFVNVINGDAGVLLQRNLNGGPLVFRFANQAYDLEFSNVWLSRSRHLVSYGGNYRHNNFNLSFAPLGASRDEQGAYVQDQIFLSERYRWIVGARIDHVDVLNRPVLSPRTTFLIKPQPNQTVRLSFNRAFRAPSFVNSFLSTTFLNQLDLGQAGPYQFPTLAIGNGQLSPEVLTAYEMAYVGGFGRTTVGAAVYVNHTKNMIQFTQAGSYTSVAPPPSWPLSPDVLDQLIAAGHGLPSRFTYLNFDRIRDRGLELSAEIRLGPVTSAFTNYSWQSEPKPTGFDISEMNLPAAHRFNTGWNMARGRYFGSLSASFVSRAYWQDVLPGYQGWTPAYTVVDAGFGVHASDQTMTVAVTGKNILNRSVQQHIFGDVIRRTVIGEVRFRF
jgi:outer membrane receptor protein involved in Fe transport